MTTILLIVLPCCVVGAVVGLAMSKWEPTRDSGYAPSFRPARPPLPFSETYLDWPIPQLERLRPTVLAGIAAGLALWILAWIVALFVGLAMLSF